MKCLVVKQSNPHLRSPSDLVAQWDVVLAELITRPRPPAATTTPSGAVLLGTGRTADVWGLGPYAIKIFRHRRGLSIPSNITSEISTYVHLQHFESSGLPQLYAYGWLDTPALDPNACGWAIFARIAGHALTFDVLEHLNADRNNRLVSDVVGKALTLEARLKTVTPLPDWNRNYSDSRVVRLQKWSRSPGIVSSSDAALATEIGTIIQAERTTLTYIHGDFNPPNIMADFSRITEAHSIVTFIDPMISYDAPELNWRHFTLRPALADALAYEYSKRTNLPMNDRLMYSIGALTHLYNAIFYPEQAAFRRPAIARCLERVGLGHQPD